MAEFSEQDVEKLIRLFTESDLTTLRVKSEGVEVLLSRGSEAIAAPVQAGSPPPAAPALVAAVSAAPLPSVEATPNGQIVSAPALGTFYTAPRPDQPPYVTVGDFVEAGTTIGLIEAMKVFTAVTTDVAGTLTSVLAANNDFVEYGQPLFAIDPGA